MMVCGPGGEVCHQKLADTQLNAAGAVSQTVRGFRRLVNGFHPGNCSEFRIVKKVLLLISYLEFVKVIFKDFVLRVCWIPGQHIT